jgi:sterol desaturase/sphingolipid hydroxylase (fatty acid hydroxylase superfamily)
VDFLRQRLIDMIVGLIEPLAQIATAGYYRLFWPYLLVAVAIAYVVYRRAAAAHDPDAARGFLAFAMPREIWRHRSAATDIGVLLITSVALAAVFGPLLPAAKDVAAWLVAMLQPAAGAQTAPPSVLLVAGFTLTLLVVDDFGRFLAHYLVHRVPALWEIHKVHHAAEVLTPFTAYRIHPLEIALTALILACLVGAANAAFILAWGGGLQVMTLFHANVGLVALNLLGGVLRHSHVWLSFGPRVERYLVSPAMHQIHHSVEERHWGLNLGYHFSIWDRMFGTIYIPKGREHFALGLGEENAAWRSVTANILRPLITAPRALVPSAGRRAETAARSGQIK